MICWSYLRDKEKPAADYVSYEEITTRVIADLTSKLKKKATQFDSIACQGMSGITVALPVAHQIGVPCVTVDRAADKHGERVINNAYAGTRVLFMDDHFGSGTTLYFVAKALKLWAPNATIIATYCYNPAATYKLHPTTREKVETKGWVVLDENHPYWHRYQQGLTEAPKARERYW